MSQRAFRSRGGHGRWPVPCDRCGARAGRACIPDGIAARTTCPDHASRRRAIAAHREANP